jgi:iron(III) transport system substrate-binding protein
MRRFRMIPPVLALALVAVACGSDDDGASEPAPTTDAVEPATTQDPANNDAAPTETAAQAEPEPEPEIEDDVVVMCTVQEEWCEAAVSAFSDASGIDAQYVRLSTGEGIARLEAEGDDPSFDVWFGGPSLGPATAASGGFIEPYVSDNAAAIPDSLKSADGTWTGIYVGALGFCSNAEFLDELGIGAPESYQDLLDPALDNNIAMADQRTSGTAATAGANLVALLGTEDAALDYLKKLDSNIFQYTRSGSAPGRMAAQGEVATAVIFSHDCVAFELETGVDLIASFPAEGTGFEVGQVSLIANADHPGAARAFLDWALTPEAQEVAATVNAFQIPSHPDAAVPEQAISLDDVVLADGYSPQLAEDLRGGDFPERFANEVRGGSDAPE